MTAPDEDEILEMDDAGPEVVGLPGRFTLNAHPVDAYDVDEAKASRSFSNEAFGDAFVFEDEDEYDGYDDAASLEATETVVRGRTSASGARARTSGPRPATVAWGATFAGLVALAGATAVLGIFILAVRWISGGPEPVVEAPPPPVVVAAPVAAAAAVAPEPEVAPEPVVAEPEPEPVAKTASRPRRAPAVASEPEPEPPAEVWGAVAAPAPAPVVAPEPEDEKKKGLFKKKKD